MLVVGLVAAFGWSSGARAKALAFLDAASGRRLPLP